MKMNGTRHYAKEHKTANNKDVVRVLQQPGAYVTVSRVSSVVRQSGRPEGDKKSVRTGDTVCDDNGYKSYREPDRKKLRCVHHTRAKRVLSERRR